MSSAPARDLDEAFTRAARNRASDARPTLKVLFAIKSLNAEGGGAERVLTQVASELAGRSHSVSVISFDAPGGRSFYPLAPSVRRIDLGGGRSLPLPHQRLEPIARVPDLRRAIVGESPDVVVPFMHSMYVPAAIAMVGLPTPLICSEHASRAHYQSRRLEGALAAAAVHLAQGVTVPSDSVLKELRPAQQRKTLTIPNPVDLDQLRRAHATMPGDVILCVGRLSEEKRPGLLLDAFIPLAPHFPSWKLRMVGNGPLRPSLEARARQNGLEGRVEFAGFSRDVSAEYSAAAVVAIPSAHESFSMVAAEALAACRPVVAFDSVAALRELVVPDTTGILVPESSAHGLEDALARLMRSPADRVRLGSAGPEHVAHLGVGPVADRWETLLHSVCDRSSRLS